jgi:hypothetical protein
MRECKYCEQKDYQLKEEGVDLIHTVWDSLVCKECMNDLYQENGGVDLPI